MFHERLTLPWWLWLAALSLAGLLAAELHLGAQGTREWLPYAIIVPLVAFGCVWMGRLRVAVTGGELQVDDARLPTRFIEGIEPLDAAARRDVLGVHSHPLAFVIQRPWISGTALVTLNDPDDPTPYWVVSTRHPEALAAAVRATQRAERAAAT
ncbi:MAG: DUF3093 domain-containing protein [Longispora sp.]|nr:DUF3093 domain-containing protein [Longispora sp. (in: high G+C Gram-positive bacteria)]